MASEKDSRNGWSTYEKLVLDKLDRHEKLLDKMDKNQNDTNRKVSGMCKDFAVTKAKIYAVVCTITVVISAGWQVVTRMIK